MALLILGTVLFLLTCLGWVFLAMGWVWAGVAILVGCVIFTVWFIWEAAP